MANRLAFGRRSAPPAPALHVDDGLDFNGWIQPPEVPPDPVGNEWRGEPGPPGPPGPGAAPSDAVPLMDGTGAAGTAGTASRGDHVHPSDTSRLPLTGGTLSGPLTINSGTDPTLYLTSTSGVWPGVALDGLGNYISGSKSGIWRWEIDLVDGSAETGGNAGSNFGIARYDDAGNQIGDYVLSISRATGLITLGGLVNINVDMAGTFGVYPTNTSAANGAIAEFSTTNDVPHYAGYGITGSGYVGYADTAYLETSASGGLQIITDDATTSVTVWIGNTAPLPALEANAAGVTLNGPLTIQSDTDATLYIKSAVNWPGLALDSPAGNTNYLYGSRNNLGRWEIDLGEASPETGGNAGSDFQIYRFDDAGHNIPPPVVYISRATGLMTLIGDPTAALGVATKQYADSRATALLALVNTWTKAQRSAPVALTDGATITADFDAGNNFSVTLGGNRTLANPSNGGAGQSGQLVITQDGTGSRTLAFGSHWKFPAGAAPVLSTAAGSVDILSYYQWDSTHIAVSGAFKFA